MYVFLAGDSYVVISDNRKSKSRWLVAAKAKAVAETIAKANGWTIERRNTTEGKAMCIAFDLKGIEFFAGGQYQDARFHSGTKVKLVDV